MNYVWNALNSDQKINYRFVTDLQKTTQCPSGWFSFQTRILRAAIKFKKLNKKFHRRADNFEHHQRLIAERNERIKVLKRREAAKAIGGLGEYKAAKRLTTANRESLRRMEKDAKAVNRLSGRVERWHKKIEALNEQALRSM